MVDFFRQQPVARRFALGALALHLLAAWFSTGFHQYDEQFCVIEFAGYKLGLTPLADMNDHFQERMRPWLMSWIFVGVAKGLGAVGIADPFSLSFAFRLFSALLGWVSVVAWFPIVARAFAEEKVRRFVWGALALFWLFPYVHARTSAESWSGSFFFLGLACLVGENPWRPTARTWVAFLVGALWGLAFECRFQSGFLVAGAALWCLLVARMPWFRWLGLIGGIALALAVGVLFDRAGYGEWTLAAWNYLRWQLLEGNVNRWGTQSPPAFLLTLLGKGAFPVSLLAMVAVVVSWGRFPWHPLTWATLPFTGMHFAIGHKEERFLFPMLTAIPLQAGLVWQAYGARVRWRVWRGVWLLALVVNAIYLLAASLSPARTEIALYRFLYPQTGVLYYTDRNPYVLANVAGGFYRPPGLRLEKVETFAEMSAVPPEGYWIFADETHGPVGLPSGAECVRAYTSLPGLAKTEFGAWIVKRSRMIQWNIYRCRQPAVKG